MRLVFAGTPAAAVPTLDALLKSRHEVVAVVTRPEARAGRGLKLGQSPVAQRAAEAGIEVLTPAKPAEPDFLARLREIGPDCCPVTAYGALLPQATLDIPAHGWVNLHFSVLPAWRGAAPVQHAILHGDDITGATTFRIVRELDAGPVYGVVTESIRPADTAGDLLERLSTAGALLMVATLDGIESGELEAREQPADGVSLAPKITPADAEVDWRKPAIAIGRQIRACTPDPGAWTQLDGVRIKLWPVAPSPGSAAAGSAAPGSGAPGSGAPGSPALGSPAPGSPGSGALAPGELRVTGARGEAARGEAGRGQAGRGQAGRGQADLVLVGTGSTPVVLGDVQANGKRRMPAGDWARGLRLDGRSGVLG